MATVEVVSAKTILPEEASFESLEKSSEEVIVAAVKPASEHESHEDPKEADQETPEAEPEAEAEAGANEINAVKVEARVVNKLEAAVEIEKADREEADTQKEVPDPPVLVKETNETGHESTKPDTEADSEDQASREDKEENVAETNEKVENEGSILAKKNEKKDGSEAPVEENRETPVEKTE